jgi:hypothetical protein
MTTINDLRARLSAMRIELVHLLVQNGVEYRQLPAVAGIDASLDALAEMPEVEEMPTPDMLRDRLRQVREDALFGMARHGIEPGRLALAAGADAALQALGEPSRWRERVRYAVPMLDKTKVGAALGHRAVVSADGETTWLTLRDEIGAVAAVELDPVRSVALANQLIEAALPRLS